MTDRQQIEEGKVIKFGISQINNVTPIWIKYIMRGIQFISGLWAIIPYDMINIQELTYGKVTRWIALFNAIVFFFVKFFGWDDPNEQQNNVNS